MSSLLLRWWTQLLVGAILLMGLWSNLDADNRAFGLVEALLAAVFLFGAGSAWARRADVGTAQNEVEPATDR